jgi:hypothetical protein
MSSPPPSTPQIGAADAPPTEGALSAYEKTRREVEASMRSSPPPEDEDEDMYSGNNGAQESDPATGSASFTQSSPIGHVSPWSTSSLRIETERARRLAISKKLHPYQRDDVETFLKVSNIQICLRRFSSTSDFK